MLSKNALRQLMAQAASAGSLQTVYQTALRGVQEALDVERASLLVFDVAGTMRLPSNNTSVRLAPKPRRFNVLMPAVPELTLPE